MKQIPGKWSKLRWFTKLYLCSIYAFIAGYKQGAAYTSSEFTHSHSVGFTIPSLLIFFVWPFFCRCLQNKPNGSNATTGLIKNIFLYLGTNIIFLLQRKIFVLPMSI